jgi:hypothetical protein
VDGYVAIFTFDGAGSHEVDDAYGYDAMFRFAAWAMRS